MSVCTFFGHKDSPQSIQPALHTALVELIEHQGVDLFYMGNHGAFDRMAYSVVRELSAVYPHIRYAVVLAYLPEHPQPGIDYSETLYPEGLETAPRRFAISWRNRWMLDQADHVVAYIHHGWGGAAQFAEKAVRAKKHVVNLGPYPL